VSAAAIALALGAAALHAVWNVLLAGARDTQTAAALALAVAAVAFAPVAAFTWDADAAVIPYAVASAALELAYFALLAAAYARFRLSVIYPISRGTAPVLVLIVSVVALGASTSAVETAGIALVATGVLLVGGNREDAAGGDLLVALAIAGCIAGYTLVDNAGIRHAEPIPYLELVLAGPALAYVAAVGVARGGRTLRRELRIRVVAAGLAMFGAYALVLAALRLAPAAPVAAVRETSVVIGVALAALLLREPVGRLGGVGAVLVAGGVVAIGAG
jgi:drug/metabolite transporter (DMT)-like permease